MTMTARKTSMWAGHVDGRRANAFSMQDIFKKDAPQGNESALSQTRHGQFALSKCVSKERQCFRGYNARGKRRNRGRWAWVERHLGF